MPVLVTGAEAGTGRAVVARLLRTGGEVRVYLDPEAAPDALVERYRRSGVKVARGSLEDEGRLELALAQVHTVMHTRGGPLDEPAAVLDDVASVLSAAIGAGCRRVVWTSQIGAEAPGSDPYLMACAEAEALLADAPLETVVVRRAVTYGSQEPLTALLAAGIDGVDPRARHAPLYADDLAAALQAADAERGRTEPGHVAVTLTGPDVVELSELVEGLRKAGAHRLVPHRPPPPHLAELLSRDALPGPSTLGRTGTPLAEGLARTRPVGA
ncbi:MAG TPA: NAD(P)H-binding protein [Egibacteraceae bacterium]|jgi:NAD(P)H dehydrogenase (quinone)|nr:NAD(P)H-binding protein [Egibacteraceae bacterium]